MILLAIELKKYCTSIRSYCAEFLYFFREQHLQYQCNSIAPQVEFVNIFCHEPVGHRTFIKKYCISILPILLCNDSLFLSRMTFPTFPMSMYSIAPQGSHL